MSTWGDFQSVIQLSIAANGTVAAFPDFFKGSTETNVSIAEDLIKQTASLNISGVEHRNRQKDIKDRLQSLKGDYRRISLRQNTFIYNFLSWISMLFILCGVTAILISSFNYRHPIHVSGKIFVIVQLAPFILGLAAVAGFSTFSLIVLRSRRLSILKDLNELDIAVREAAVQSVGANFHQEQANAV